MTNKEIINTSIEALTNDLKVTTLYPEGITVRDVRMYIKGTYNTNIPAEEIIAELVQNKSLEFTFRKKEEY